MRVEPAEVGGQRVKRQLASIQASARPFVCLLWFRRGLNLFIPSDPFKNYTDPF